MHTQPKSSFSAKWLFVSVFITIVSFLLSITLGLSQNASIAVSVTTLCTVLWISEALPIPITACIPMAVFPTLGIISRADIGNSLGNPINFLLIGGFILSIAMVKTKAHLRLCQAIFHVLQPKSYRQMVVTFMICACFLSMWISNAAATMILIPIALATIKSQEASKQASVLLLLGIAYAASIGGIGTPIGTPPNLLFMQAYEVATEKTISFLEWMGFGVPIMLVLFVIAVCWIGYRIPNTAFVLNMQNESSEAGQTRVLLIFGIIVALWITRSDPFGGWSVWFNMPNSHDGYIALLGAIALFVIPLGDTNKRKQAILEWSDTKELPWGIVLLVSGGISISLALKNTGLVTDFASQLVIFKHWPLWIIIGIVCLSVTFLTEVMSNTACTALLMPVLASVALALDIDPILIMLPAAITASCAFMMPMATAPNAIVFATQAVPIKKMVNTGFGLNLVAVGAVVLLVKLI